MSSTDSVPTYLGARRVLSSSLASLGRNLCSIVISFIVCRSIQLMTLRRELLVSMMGVFRYGAVDDRTTRGRLEEVGVEWVEVEVTRE